MSDLQATHRLLDIPLQESLSGKRRNNLYESGASRSSTLMSRRAKAGAAALARKKAPKSAGAIHSNSKKHQSPGVLASSLSFQHQLPNYQMHLPSKQQSPRQQSGSSLSYYDNFLYQNLLDEEDYSPDSTGGESSLLMTGSPVAGGSRLLTRRQRLLLNQQGQQGLGRKAGFYDDYLYGLTGSVTGGPVDRQLTGYGGQTQVIHYQEEKECRTGLNPFLVALVLGGLAVGSFVIFRYLTLNGRRRSFEDGGGRQPDILDQAANLFYIGRWEDGDRSTRADRVLDQMKAKHERDVI